MATIGEVFRTYGGAYLDAFGGAMPAVHKRAIELLAACRTGELGYVHWHCDSCGADHVTDRSCGNRHCPQCQHAKADAWLRRETGRLLPCEYFLVTFTVPEEARRFFRSNQELCYGAMFDAASAALKTLGRDERFVGARDLGFFGVLQSWGSQLQFHPHIHFVVAGGGLDAEGTWRPARPGFLFRVEPLSKIYRANMQRLLRDAAGGGDLPPIAWTKGWNIDCRPVGSGEAAVKYVGRYVFRVAISNSRIVSCENGRVVFSYDDKKNGTKLCSLSAQEFIRRFLQHVLPKGFVKVRHYGLMHHNARHSIEEVRAKIHAATGEQLREPAVHDDGAGRTQTAPPCPTCGKPMRFMAVTGLTIMRSG